MTAFRHIVIAFLSASALAACGPGTVRLRSDINDTTYTYRNFDLYHGGRDTEVIVYGNPFGMDARAFAEAVTRHMQGANAGPSTNFTTTPANAERNLRVVMAFNADTSGYRLCSGRPVAGGPQGETIRLNAAWCWENSPQSSVEAETGAVSGVGDPRFRALVRQTVLNLFPREDPLRREDDDRRRRGRGDKPKRMR